MDRARSSMRQSLRFLASTSFLNPQVLGLSMVIGSFPLDATCMDCAILESMIMVVVVSCRFTLEKAVTRSSHVEEEQEKDSKAESEPVITAELIILEKLLGSIRPATSDSELARPVLMTVGLLLLLLLFRF